MFPQRRIQSLGFKIPTGIFNGSFRHTMTAHGLHQFPGLRGGVDFFADAHGSEKRLDCRPCRFGPLVRIKRAFSGSALAPTLSAVDIGYANQQDAPLSSTSEAGFEELN